MSMVHPMARTTPRTRAEIHDSAASVAELAQAYNISSSTARKWRNRDDLLDRSHKAHQLHTTLSPAQELIVMEIRRLCLLPLDDLVAVTKQFINADASRSGVSRLLRREGLSKLSDLEPRVEGEETSRKTFKDYEPGFVHIDIKFLPKMPDEAQHSYLFVAIDRATRWVFMRIYADQTQGSAVDFLRRVHEAAAFKITKLLTDNGTQFTDRFTSKNKQASGRHSFDRQCKALEIEHRLSPPRRPQTNGMVERFNGRISEVIKQTRFASAAELASTLNNYWQAYNHHIPQRALGHVSPVDSLKNWHQKKPELFRKRIYKQAELDSYESDEHGAFDVTAGVAVPPPAAPVPGAVQIAVQAGDYLVFHGHGTMPQMVIDAWGEVWRYFAAHPQLPRRFGTDFELYEGPDRVAIHIGIAPGAPRA